MDLFCTQCGTALPAEANFCSHCGVQIKEPGLSVSAATQFRIYCVSFFVPPFGLWYAYKYLKHGGATEEKIGYVAIVLTLVGIGLVIWSVNSLIQSVNQSLEGLVY